MKIGRKQTSVSAESKNFLGILQLAILAVQALILVLMLVLALRVGEVASRRPTFAQLVNGQTVYISEQERNWRASPTLRGFVEAWTILTFNWQGTLSGTQQTDEGVEVGGKKIPTNSWLASTMMEPKLAKAFLPLLADLVPSELFSGKIRAVTTFEYISEPRQIAPGRWQVDIVASRILINSETGADDRIAFNRRFTLKATEIPNSPLGQDASPIEQKVYELQSAGLQIVDIVPYDPTKG